VGIQQGRAQHPLESQTLRRKKKEKNGTKKEPPREKKKTCDCRQPGERWRSGLKRKKKGTRNLQHLKGGMPSGVPRVRQLGRAYELSKEV